jgi:hypothetical protein
MKYKKSKEKNIIFFNINIGSVKLRKIYELNYKILLKLSTEHNMKVKHPNYYILKLTGP